jgi:hypothetical protein
MKHELKLEDDQKIVGVLRRHDRLDDLYFEIVDPEDPSNEDILMLVKEPHEVMSMLDSFPPEFDYYAFDGVTLIPLDDHFPGKPPKMWRSR